MAPRRVFAERDQAVGADAAMPLAQFTRERRAIGAGGTSSSRSSRKSFPNACALTQILHLVQKASRCQPKRRTQARGSALKVPTKNVLNKRPLPPAVQPRLHRKPFLHDPHVAKAGEQARGTRRRCSVSGPARLRARAAPSSPSTARSATRRGCRPGTPRCRPASARGGIRPPAPDRAPCTGRRRGRRRNRTRCRRTAASRRPPRAGPPSAPAARNSVSPGRWPTRRGRRR